LKDAAWFVLTTAIAIPAVGWIVAHISARISRTTARETALLAAAQRRRDAEISQVDGARDDLLAAATAVQSFAWYVKKETRLRTKLSEEEWHENREFFENAVNASGRLRAVALAMSAADLRNSYVAVSDLIMNVLSGGDEDAWDKDLENQPDTITRAIGATADEIRRLYVTYPSELPSRASDRTRLRLDVAIVGSIAATAVLAFVAGWFW
jgi:hypothetical protein